MLAPIETICYICENLYIMEPEFLFAIGGFLGVAIIILPIAIWAVGKRLRRYEREERYEEEYYRYIKAKRQALEKMHDLES